MDNVKYVSAMVYFLVFLATAIPTAVYIFKEVVAETRSIYMKGKCLDTKIDLIEYASIGVYAFIVFVFIYMISLALTGVVCVIITIFG